jgi:cell division inhibitor SulA/protein ImuA
MASLVEVLIDASGLGEIQLFLPALVQSQRKRDGDAPWIVWIAPPHEPFAPALAQQGIELSRFIIVRPASAMEALWAAEQALSSGVCAAVLLWLKGSRWLSLRRLKLAAEEGGALGVLFRPERHRFESSPAVLRLLLSQGESEPCLSLLKVQGGRPGPIEPEPNPLDLSLFEPCVFEQGS